MPGAVPRTSTIALNNATLPYALQIAGKGYLKALQDNEPLSFGLNTINGVLTNKGVGEALNLPYSNVESSLK